MANKFLKVPSIAVHRPDEDLHKIARLGLAIDKGKASLQVERSVLGDNNYSVLLGSSHPNDLRMSIHLKKLFGPQDLLKKLKKKSNSILDYSDK